MKCEIIRDLMPSYADRLTSKDSDQVIEEHLKNCKDCREYLEEMKRDVPKQGIITSNKKAIKPFKKIRRRMWKAVGITFLVCILLFAGVNYYYGHSWTVSSDKVDMSINYVGKIMDMKFLPLDENICLTAVSSPDDPYTVTIEAYRENPFHKSIRKNGYYGLTFMDAQTVMLAEGGEQKLSGDEVLTIRYEDKAEELNLKELAEAASEEKLVSSGDVEVSYKQSENGVITIDIQPELVGLTLTAEKEGDDTVKIIGHYDREEDSSEHRGVSYSYTFLDESTILAEDGRTMPLTGEELLTLKFDDKTEQIRIADLMQTVNQ